MAHVLNQQELMNMYPGIIYVPRDSIDEVHPLNQSRGKTKTRGRRNNRRLKPQHQACFIHRKILAFKVSNFLTIVNDQLVTVIVTIIY